MWLLVTALAVLVANTAVMRVRSAVTDAPLPLGLPPLASSGAGTSSDAVDRMGVSQSSTTSAGSTEPSTVPTGTSAAPPTPAATQPASGSAAPPPTTAPPTSAAGQYSTFNTDGGWVTIRQVGNEVYFEAAGPKSGWQVIPESTGPRSVAVKFKRQGEELTFKAEFEGGKLETSVEH